jgi:AcrR family transcriptional regulator
MRADARRNCERIIEVARTVFREDGVDAPLDEIVKRAKIGAGTLYRHFPTRDTLIEQVYRAEIVGLSDRAYQLAKKFPPEQALTEWIREQVRWVLGQHGLAASLKAVIDHDSEVFQLCRTALRDAADALLKPLQDSGKVRADVASAELLRLCHALAIAIENQPEEQAELMISIMLRGLRP